MKLSLAMQTAEVSPAVPVSLLSGTFEERLGKAARLGIDGVELMTADPIRLDAAAIRSRLAENGLEVAAVGSGAVAFVVGLTLLHSNPDIASQARARLNHLVDFAAMVGAPLVTVGSFRGWLAKAGRGAPDRLACVLHEAASYAQAREIRLALEPLNRYESDVLKNAEQGLVFL